MDRYAIKGKDKCNGYIPCHNIQQHPAYQTERNRLFGEWSNTDIKNHPGYKNLMNRYAIQAPASQQNGEKGCAGGINGEQFIPCKEIRRHPQYEKERTAWKQEWNKLPITEHPQYRSSVERLLKDLLERLGGQTKCQINNSELNAMAGLVGGSVEIREAFACPVNGNGNGNKNKLDEMINKVVHHRSKPCPVPPINDHPDYEKLVNAITAKVSSEFGCKGQGCVGIQKCSEFVPEVRKLEQIKCKQQLKTLDEKIKVEAVKSKDNQEALKQRHAQMLKCSQDDANVRIKRLQKKMQEQHEDDKSGLTRNLNKLKSELQCCQNAYKELKSRPICNHPDYEEALKREQTRLLEKIMTEQTKCRQQINYNYGANGTRNADMMANTGVGMGMSVDAAGNQSVQKTSTSASWSTSTSAPAPALAPAAPNAPAVATPPPGSNTQTRVRYTSLRNSTRTPPKSRAR